MIPSIAKKIVLIFGLHKIGQAPSVRDSKNFPIRKPAMPPPTAPIAARK